MGRAGMTKPAAMPLHDWIPACAGMTNGARGNDATGDHALPIWPLAYRLRLRLPPVFS